MGQSMALGVSVSIPNWLCDLATAINPEAPPTGISITVGEVTRAGAFKCSPDDPARIVDQYLLNWWDNPGAKPPSYAPAWDHIQQEDYELFVKQVSLLYRFLNGCILIHRCRDESQA